MSEIHQRKILVIGPCTSGKTVPWSRFSPISNGIGLQRIPKVRWRSNAEWEKRDKSVHYSNIVSGDISDFDRDMPSLLVDFLEALFASVLKTDEGDSELS
jgi:hypothetical protein